MAYTHCVSVCLVPKDPNQAVKRSHHHTQTLEEITHKFKGNTVFSKLDACHGYWSVVLDEESSYLTFSTAHLGDSDLPIFLLDCVLAKMFSNRIWTLFL